MQQEAFLIIKWEEFPALIDLIGLITSTDFNRLSIDLKLVIIDFSISSPSTYMYIHIYMYMYSTRIYPVYRLSVYYICLINEVYYCAMSSSCTICTLYVSTCTCNRITHGMYMYIVHVHNYIYIHVIHNKRRN